VFNIRCVRSVTNYNLLVPRACGVAAPARVARALWPAQRNSFAGVIPHIVPGVILLFVSSLHSLSITFLTKIYKGKGKRWQVCSACKSEVVIISCVVGAHRAWLSHGLVVESSVSAPPPV
jgi:hypothetical protein